MADHVSKLKRSEIMRAVPGKNTTPELALRRWLHAHGYRYRLHDPKLPGKPDLVFAGRRAIIFVNGCFWHGHHCKKGRAPKSNTGFWAQKIATNRARDQRVLGKLRKLGYRCRVVWQCQLKDPDKTGKRLMVFLEGPSVANSTRI